LSTLTGIRRFFVETWGCQMNELDSQRLSGQLMQQGVLPTLHVEEADLILLNSCSVRERAEQKVYSRLGEYRLLKRDREKPLFIGLCGCVAQQEGERALARVPDLDFVLGPARVGELREVLRQRLDGHRVVATGFPVDRRYDLDAVSRDGLYKGMVTIIEGCNKNCTFCIVPSTRGPEACRTFDEILVEVRHLLDLGFVEIELLGQTVNHWREPATGRDFADLLAAVASLPGIRRLRFVTSYPRDFSPRMVEQIGLHETICPYVHLPVQSGSDRLLRRMGRGYQIDTYLRLVESLRQARPGIAISTDLIAGFPGETEADHRDSIALLEQVRHSALFAFCYSPRPGTAAARLPDPAVPSDVAEARLQDLLRTQNGIQRELNEELVGREFDVLVTGWGREAGAFTGRTTCHRIMHFRASDPRFRAGHLARVRVVRANPHSLVGEEVA